MSILGSRLFQDLGRMVEHRNGVHSVFEIHSHLVWVTKYRKPVLGGAVGCPGAGPDPRDLRWPPTC